MKSYTLGTDAMVRATIMALPEGERYDMSLTVEDMAPLLWALAAQTGFVEPSDGMKDRATSLLSSIAETLGVEGV